MAHISLGIVLTKRPLAERDYYFEGTERSSRGVPFFAT
jgi:hypothetical protein